MNVVFLLLTTAVTAGDAPANNKPADNKPVEVKPAPTVTHAPITASSACNAGACGAATCSCDPCADKPGLLDRLRAKFRRGDDCCEKAPRQKVCGGEGSGCFGSGGGLLSRFGHKGQEGCCGVATSSCDPCADKPGLLDRLRAKFRRGNDCCEAPAAPCCGTASGAVIAPAVKPGTVQHGAVIHGTVPNGTYATTPQITPAPKSAPISAQPVEPRQKLPGSGAQGSPILAPAVPVPAAKPTVTTTPVLTPTAATAETSGPGL